MKIMPINNFCIPNTKHINFSSKNEPENHSGDDFSWDEYYSALKNLSYQKLYSLINSTITKPCPSDYPTRMTNSIFEKIEKSDVETSNVEFF